MPIGSASFAAGGYTATFDGTALGLLQASEQGPLLRLDHKVQRIEGTNSYGMSLIGGIYLGRDADLRGVLMEYNAGALKVLFPWTAGATIGRIGAIGQEMYDVSKSLVLTAISGGLSASVGPATLTASKAVLAPGFPVDILMSPQLRTLPFALSLLPFSDSGNNANFTST